MFIGHPDAGDRSAILYSIIISCERRGIDPAAYLRDVVNVRPGAHVEGSVDETEATFVRDGNFVFRIPGAEEAESNARLLALAPELLEIVTKLANGAEPGAIREDAAALLLRL